MTYRLIATYEPADGQPGDAAGPMTAWLSSPGLDAIAGTPGLTRFETLVPDPGAVRFFDDGPPPAMMVHLTAVAADALINLAKTDRFIEMFYKEPQNMSGLASTFGIYRVIATPIDKTSDPQVRSAALSFVVRYFEPIDEPDRFRDFYVANHPPILARFPGVRNVFCYLPVDTDLGELPAANVALGNEVVFDDLTALNIALSSDILADLKDDSKNFPPFGSSSHHAMIRRRHFTPA